MEAFTAFFQGLVAFLRSLFAALKEFLANKTATTAA